MSAAPAFAVLEQMIEDRQRKSGGLAGSGLRNADDVAGRQHLRNGLRLDWCRVAYCSSVMARVMALRAQGREKPSMQKSFLLRFRACQGVWHTTANRGGNGTPAWPGLSVNYCWIQGSNTEKAEFVHATRSTFWHRPRPECRRVSKHCVSNRTVSKHSISNFSVSNHKVIGRHRTTMSHPSNATPFT